jgi:membrane protein YqaA with SNARE-associated domain
MIRRPYKWCTDAAGKPHASLTLGLVSFAESSFFPVPPDIMLIPMALARPDKAWLFAAICTVTSVAGGMLGYLIGAALYDKVEAFRAAYAQYGALITLLKGLTPIPYKIETITSGFAGFNIGLFIVMSVITRGARLFLEAFLLNRYSPRALGVVSLRLHLSTAHEAASRRAVRRPAQLQNLGSVGVPLCTE